MSQNLRPRSLPDTKLPVFSADRETEQTGNINLPDSRDRFPPGFASTHVRNTFPGQESDPPGPATGIIQSPSCSFTCFSARACLGSSRVRLRESHLRAQMVYWNF
jgi:hypothetical protein